MPVISIGKLFNDFVASKLLPVLEIRLLMMHALHKTRVELITQSDELLSDAQVTHVQTFIERRVQGEPIAYLTGHREFFGLVFQVTRDVLIPRPETELLVELSLTLTPSNSTVLDLGTGSGAIAVAMAYQRRDLHIWASDISEPALAIARCNADQYQCSIQFLQSNWYDNLPHQRWQTIVSNPPYIVQNDHHLYQGDLRFEPIDALTDHADGLSAYHHIIKGATTRLVKNGWLLVEHGYDQAQSVRDLFKDQGFSCIQSWRDLAGIERVCAGKMM